jgi:hypothetical protein
MSPGGGLLTAINSRLQLTTFRDQIRTLHAAEAPLLEMVDALDLAPEMSPAVRAVVAALDDATVAGIRQATLDMLNRAENEMPVDCNMTEAEIDAGQRVGVSVIGGANGLVIQVRA